MLFWAYVWQFSWNWRAISCQTLPWYLFNLQWVSRKFYGEIRVSETFVSVGDLLDLVFIFFFCCGSSLRIFDTDLKRTDLIFNFALSFFYQYLAPFWYRYPLLFLYHDELAELVSNIKCSIGGSQATGVYSNLVSLWPRRWIFLEIEGQYQFRPFPWYLFNLRWVSHIVFFWWD